ncbi:IS110 family transposase, partial [Carboxydothermus pertinax]
MDNLGEIVSKRQKFSNDNPGLEALINLVLDICHSNSFERVVIGLESTSVYSWHLQMGLASNYQLASYHCQV